MPGPTRDVDADLLQQLRDFYESHAPPANLFLENPQSAYISLALWLGPPPDFELEADPADLPPDALFVRDGFVSLIPAPLACGWCDFALRNVSVFVDLREQPRAKRKVF